MLIFFRPSVLLLAICALLCVIVPVFGARPLESNGAWQDIGFTTCELPCFSGITPGKTPFQETTSLLHEHNMLIENRTFSTSEVTRFWALDAAQEFSGIIANNGGVVGEVFLTGRLPVDYLIGQLGMPDCLMRHITEDPYHVLTLHWIRQGGSVEAMLDQRIFTLKSGVAWVWLRPSTAPCAIERAFRWRGFVPDWKFAQ